MPGFTRSAVTALFILPACGAARGQHAEAPLAVPDASIQIGTAREPVQAGAYRLSMSTSCNSRERTATGILTLKPISGARSPPAESDGSSAGPSEAALLWGQTDLDFEQFRSCLGNPSSAAGEPIHPSVLVEVLQWDGEPHHQVLLVSTDPRYTGDLPANSGAGVAMWVERVAQGHIGGVWSRWELIGQGEGRWEADLIEPARE